MIILKPSRCVAQRLLAGLALALAGCASAPWDDWFSDAPAAQPAAVAPLASVAPVVAGYYRVNRGDTLASVAAAFGREPAQIARWNRLSVDAELRGAQVLRVAPYPGEASSPASARVPQAAADNAAAARQTRFHWPAPGPVIARFEAGQSRGIHIGGNAGDTIKAAGDGRVIYAGSQIKAYGLLVIVKHDRRFVSAYGNNAKVLVKEGDVVKQGQPIAEMGAASDANPYLIFELRDGTKAVDPQGYLPKRPG
jgi:lipoprotein NlpD